MDDLIAAQQARRDVSLNFQSNRANSSVSLFANHQCYITLTVRLNAALVVIMGVMSERRVEMGDTCVGNRCLLLCLFRHLLIVLTPIQALICLSR